MTIELNTPFNYEPREGLICAGQPDEQGFRAAAQAGVVAVMNLRPDEEMEWDQAALMQELGLEYAQIPVAGPMDLNRENAAALMQWLEQHQGQSVMVHCASSNRVGALLALGSVLNGETPDQALAFGRAAGLTRMEPMVQSIMAQGF